eukprot:10435833-Alexandrium_andersonii.AAC.1
MQPPPGQPPSGSARPHEGPASAASSRSPTELVRQGAVPHTGAQAGADAPATGGPSSGPPVAPKADGLNLALLRAKLRER